MCRQTQTERVRQKVRGSQQLTRGQHGNVYLTEPTQGHSRVQGPLEIAARVRGRPRGDSRAVPLIRTQLQEFEIGVTNVFSFHSTSFSEKGSGRFRWMACCQPDSSSAGGCAGPPGSGLPGGEVLIGALTGLAKIFSFVL